MRVRDRSRYAVSASAVAMKGRLSPAIGAGGADQPRDEELDHALLIAMKVASRRPRSTGCRKRDEPHLQIGTLRHRGVQTLVRRSQLGVALRGEEQDALPRETGKRF